MNSESVENITEIFKALSDPTRLKLMMLLATPADDLDEKDCCGGGRFYCVNALANQLGVSQSAVSQHLRVLRQVKLVRGIRQGKFMHYTVDPVSMNVINEVKKVFG